MEAHIPDVELFIVFKWIIVLMIISAMGTLASLLVKRLWYGTVKHSRREDEEVGRGWLQRFLKLQEDHTTETVALRSEMHEVQTALRENGSAIRELARSLECRYPENKHGR